MRKKRKKNTQISKQPPLKSQEMGTKGKEKRSLLRLTDTGMQCTFGVEPRIPVPILSWRFHNYPSEKFFFIFDIKLFLPLLEDYSMMQPASSFIQPVMCDYGKTPVLEEPTV